ncbi:MAG: co-chaperone GroES, partial [Chlamydiae bacterium]|nr:co-chaperone GroES [Chlamydiota bacterium]
KRDEEGRMQIMSLKIGDKVLFSSYAGTEVKTEDTETEYLIMSEEDVLGVLA